MRTARLCLVFQRKAAILGVLLLLSYRPMVRGSDSGKMMCFWGDGFRLDGEIGEQRLNGR